MADLNQLKQKYAPVIDTIQKFGPYGATLDSVDLDGEKLHLKGTVPSTVVANRVWDQIKLVDPSFSDLIADIQAPEAAAAATAAAGGATSTPAARTYTVQAGDNLSKISKQFYGDANKYMKIFDANKDKLADPDKVKAGMDLIIPQ